MPKEEPLTLSVPVAGQRYFGLSKNGSYDAAQRGDIPTIRVGRVLRVPIRAMERKLDEAGAAPPRQRKKTKRVAAALSDAEAEVA